MIVNLIVSLLDGNLESAINRLLNLPTSGAEMFVIPPVAVTDRVASVTLITVPVYWALHVLLAQAPAGGGGQHPGDHHQAPGQLGLNVRPKPLSEGGLVHQHQVRPECFLTLEVKV